MPLIDADKLKANASAILADWGHTVTIAAAAAFTTTAIDSTGEYNPTPYAAAVTAIGHIQPASKLTGALQVDVGGYMVSPDRIARINTVTASISAGMRYYDGNTVTSATDHFHILRVDRRLGHSRLLLTEKAPRDTE